MKKNRTVIGVVCMVVAIAITFLVAPIVNKLSSDTVKAIRLKTDVKQGTQITEEHLEVVQAGKTALPEGIINDPALIIGKYASSVLYAGDFLTADKLEGEANSAEDVFSSLNGTKVAISVTIDTFAAGLSGKLENGDVVSMIVTDKNTGKATIPDALKYMKVITTTTSGGIDKDMIVKNEDGSYEIPSTVTLLANAEQAKMLVQYEEESTLCVALVYRGTAENAKKFLERQEEYFLAPHIDNEGTESPEETNDSTDLVHEANDIINGRADYYDVNEVIGNDE